VRLVPRPETPACKMLAARDSGQIFKLKTTGKFGGEIYGSRRKGESNNSGTVRRKA